MSQIVELEVTLPKFHNSWHPCMEFNTGKVQLQQRHVCKDSCALYVNRIQVLRRSVQDIHGKNCDSKQEKPFLLNVYSFSQPDDGTDS